MNLRRILRHLLMTHWRQRRAFPPATLHAIREAITASERRHSGQIRFAVEGALHGLRLLRGQTPRQRALEVFANLHLWDTHDRNGVLIYVLLADRAVEIVVDRGAHQRADTTHWHRICREMEAKFRDGRYREGAIGGIEAVTEVMAAHFPAT
ncbi:MAG: TPM domain-containing protein [Steroidobacteraceae bacterium]